MERTIASQVQSVSSQSKSSIQSITDKYNSSKDVSLSGRQSNRSNGRRKADNSNRNVGKCLPQNNGSGKQSSHSRWRPRGSGSVAANEEWTQVNDNQLSDKLDNKKIYGSKKHNMNHLLNFTFGSRDDALNEHRFHYRRSGGKGGQRFVRYNKEHFLQANCQFIVNDSNDYSIHSLDPDISVDWNSVEEIRFNCLTSETICPICLSSPTAPKMTRCGHIYCWSCVLHYLALSDQKWRKCPICFDAIQKDDLRSVSSVAKVDYKMGDFITLSLMKRKKGSTISTPVYLYDSNKNSSNQMFEPLNGDPVVSSYQKILIASPNQVLTQIIEREREQLLAQMIEDKDTPEVCFIESALQLLKDRETILLQKCDPNENDIKDKSLFKLGSNANVDEHKPLLQTQGAVAKDDEYYYFYQSEDGQHIYLHSLNVRMLKQEFGSLEKSPIKMKAKIIDMEWESMSDELRRRYRYLQHLPLTCEFRIVELEFDDQLISQPTSEAFRSEVIRRQKNRSKRAREERRRDQHIQVEENKRIYGIYPLPKYQLDNYRQFPSCLDKSDVYGSQSPTFSSESSTHEDLPHPNDVSASYGTTPPSAEPEFPSFASMLREGKAKPLLNVESSKSYGRAINAENDSEDVYQPPVYNYTLSDAFEAALELKTSSGHQNDNESKKVGSKKKKNKPKILISTGMKRSY